MPDDAAAIANSMGKAMPWNQQNVIGSPLRVRTVGFNAADLSFPGYRSGKNRDGFNLNVVAELRNPQTIAAGQRYTALVLAERHDLALALQWEDTVRYARHYHERAIEGNPGTVTYLYHAWLDIYDKSNPSAWIAYERAAAPVWQCIASRINTSLNHEGRSDRIQYLPAGLALTHLLERATQGYVEGVSAGSPAATANRLFSDNVHLTRLGSYFMSLVTYASVFKSSPAGAWAPAEIPVGTARALQDVAWSTVSSYYASPANPSPETCQALMRDSFCSTFYNYTGRPSNASSCTSHFSSQTSSNPFYFNPNTDRSYWFAAPN